MSTLLKRFDKAFGMYTDAAALLSLIACDKQGKDLRRAIAIAQVVDDLARNGHESAQLIVRLADEIAKDRVASLMDKQDG